MIEQLDAPKPRRKALRWASHVPTCMALLDTLPITGVLELGAGFNSTPMFFDRVQHVTSIEADREWIDRLRTSIREDDTHRIVYHNLDGYRRGTLREFIPSAVKRDALRLYLAHMQPAHNMLFVDCYAGLRLHAIENMYDRFDVCVYHDAEPDHAHQYGYEGLKIDSAYAHFVDGTFLAHTGVIVAPHLRSLLHEFKRNLRQRAEAYARFHDVKHKVTLLEVT